MAALTGWLTASPLGGSTNPAISPALSTLAVDAWPGHVAQAGVALDGAMVSALPVSAAPQALVGWRAPAFVDDWYYRVHVRPTPLALGNVLESQTRDVQLWNAWLTPQVLVSVSGLQQGLSAVGPAALPAGVGALQVQTWQVAVTRDGPGRIDTTLSWLFAAVPGAELHVTGDRVVAWSFLVDWTDGVLERLSWRTDILTSSSGAEQRRALRLAPRREFEVKTMAEGRDRALMDLMLAAWGARVFAVPVWPDVQALAVDVAAGARSLPCATTQRDFHAGGLAMLIGATAADVETVQIDAVGGAGLTLALPTQAAWSAGTRLYPAARAELVAQPELTRRTDRLTEAAVRWRLCEVLQWPADAGAESYRGAPVVAGRPEESEDLTGSWQRLVYELDNGAGMPQVTDTADAGFALQGHRWQLAGRTEQAAWRSLAWALRGRQTAVWVPTHADDLTLAAQADAVSVTIDVLATGYARFGAGRVGRRDVRIELTDGTALCRRVVGASEPGGGIERLVLDAPHGLVLRPAGAPGVQVARISWLALMRLDHDDVELHHVTDADGVARGQVIWRALRDDLELAA